MRIILTDTKTDGNSKPLQDKTMALLAHILQLSDGVRVSDDIFDKALRPDPTLPSKLGGGNAGGGVASASGSTSGSVSGGGTESKTSEKRGKGKSSKSGKSGKGSGGSKQQQQGQKQQQTKQQQQQQKRQQQQLLQKQQRQQQKDQQRKQKEREKAPFFLHDVETAAPIPAVIACLEISVSILKNSSDGSRNLLKDNSTLCIKMLQSAFFWASQRCGGPVRERLKEFCVSVLCHGVPSVDGSLVLHLRVLLESLVVGATKDHAESDTKSRNGLESSPSGRETRDGTPSVSAFPTDDLKSGGSSLSYFSVAVLEEVAKVSPRVVDALASSLVGLLQQLVTDLVKTSGSRNPRVNSGTLEAYSSSSQELYFTPTYGIIQETIIHATKSRSFEGWNQTTAGAVNHSMVPIGTALRALCSSLRLLGDSFPTNGLRDTLFGIVLQILRSTDNVQVLMTTVAVVGRWIFPTGNRRSLLTITERDEMLQTMCDLDNKGLNAVVAQPLFDLVGQLSFRVLRDHPSNLGSISGNEALNRVSGASILTADVQLRRKLQECQAAMYGKGCGTVSKMRPSERLKDVLQYDYSGIGGRLYLLAMMESLVGDLNKSPPKNTTFPASWLPTTAFSPEQKALSGYKALFGIDTDADEGRQISGRSSLSFDDKMEIDPSPTDSNQEQPSSQGRMELQALGVLAHGDPTLSQRFLIDTLRSFWALSTPSEQVELVFDFERILCQPFNGQFFRPGVQSTQTRENLMSNTVQAMVRAIRELSPMPVLSPTLLVSLSSFHKVRQEVLDMLLHQHTLLEDRQETEQHMTGQNQASGSTNGSANILALTDDVALAVKECLDALGEDHLSLQWSAKLSKSPATKRAISMDVHGMVKEATAAYMKLIETHENFDMTARKPDMPTMEEMQLWENRWVQLQRDICEVDVVQDWAGSMDHHPLLLESAWKREDWETVKSLSTSPVLMSMMEEGNPALKLSEIFLAIKERKLGDVENLHAQTAQLCLFKWQLLPSLSPASSCHAALLHSFHRLVELRESVQVMVETLNHSNRRTFPDLKNLLRYVRECH